MTDILRMLVSFIRPFRRRLLLAIGLAGGMTLLEMAPSILMR